MKKVLITIIIFLVIMFCFWIDFKIQRLKHPDAPWWTLLL